MLKYRLAARTVKQYVNCCGEDAESALARCGPLAGPAGSLSNSQAVIACSGRPKVVSEQVQVAACPDTTPLASGRPGEISAAG